MLFPDLDSYIRGVLSEAAQIDSGRKVEIERLADFIRRPIEASESSSVVFICTHNSRRSHFGQLWAQAASFWFGIANVECYSGGTVATAFNTNAIAAIEHAGMRVRALTTTDNPRYRVEFGENEAVASVFSKRYDDDVNPQQHFAAIFTCDDANESCPIVPGAVCRVALPYTDPKVSDGTGHEAAEYDRCCRAIAREMVYLMSHLSAELSSTR